MNRVMQQVDTSRFDPRVLKQAVEAIYDRSSGDGPLTMNEMWKRERAKLVQKWAWYLGEEITVAGKKYPMRPIPAEQQAMMAVLFENQMLANPEPKTLWEATTTANLSLPANFALPIIREVFPQLIMMRIANVQPMPAMSGGTANAYWWKTYRVDASDTQMTTADSDYALSSEGAVPKQVRGGLSTVSVTAITDKLNATWTQEAQEDLMGVMGLDLGAEMLRTMAEEILREIEERVLNEIFNGAAAGNTDWSDTVGSGYTATEWYETIFHAFIDSEKLVRQNRHAACNYIVCGLNVAGFLQKTQRFVAQTTPQVEALRSGTRFEGTFLNRWDVYSSEYVDSDTAVISIYPNGMHTGYIWMPYIPLMPMPRMYAESKNYDDAVLPGALVNTDSWTQNIRTRNGKYMCEPTQFATVTIT